MTKKNDKHPRPWYRPSRQTWYLTLDGRQINLGPDEQQAFARYHQLMAGLDRPPESAPVGSVVRGGDLALAVAIEEFLDYLSRERSPETYEWYRYRLQRLHEHYPKMFVANLRPIDVRKWVDKYDLAKTSRRNYMRSIKACLKWAEAEGLIEKSPLTHMRVPTAERKELYLPPDEFARALEFTPNADIRDLMTITYQTGCRPQELLIVEARHFDEQNQRWVFELSESKMKRISRIVYLTDEALQIVKRGLEKFPTGPTFRNRNGVPWTTDAVNCHFTQLQIRMAKEEMNRRGISVSDDEINEFVKTLAPTKRRRGEVVRKTDSELRHEAKTKLRAKLARQLVPRYSLYALRHSWATNALQRGLDSLTVAILMGHEDPSTLARVYQHLGHNPEHLLGQAKRAASQSA